MGAKVNDFEFQSYSRPFVSIRGSPFFDVRSNRVTHTRPRQEEISLAAWRRTGRKFRSIAAFDVRAACVLTLIAATVRDVPSNMGTASERSPGSSSWR
jgi:hypothetical protein